MHIGCTSESFFISTFLVVDGRINILKLFKDISKYLSLENSLLAEIFINFPFSILPISLKLLIEISDFVTRFSKLISISENSKSFVNIFFVFSHITRLGYTIDNSEYAIIFYQQPRKKSG